MTKRLKRNLSFAASTVLMWIFIGTVVFHFLESWTWIQSFYFSVITLTTVGYGDLVPSTDMARLFVAIYILIGVSAGVTALGIIGSDLLSSREEKLNHRKKKSKQ